MIWVVDASVAVRWFLVEEADDASDSVLREFVDKPEVFAVPELFAFEVLSVLCRMHPNGAAAFCDGLLPLLSAGVLRHPMTERLALQAAPFVRQGLTAHDACYAALASELGGRWLTYDVKAHKRIIRSRISHPLTQGLPPEWP